MDNTAEVKSITAQKRKKKPPKPLARYAGGYDPCPHSLRLLPISSDAKMIFLLLVDSVGKKGYCWKGHGTIGNECGAISKYSVRQAIAELEMIEFISVKRELAEKGKDIKGRANLYSLNWDKINAKLGPISAKFSNIPASEPVVLPTSELKTALQLFNRSYENFMERFEVAAETKKNYYKLTIQTKLRNAIENKIKLEAEISIGEMYDKIFDLKDEELYKKITDVFNNFKMLTEVELEAEPKVIKPKPELMDF